MQKQSDASGAGSEACTIKVTIEFADLMRSEQVLLDQHPEVEEDLKMQTDLIGTKGGADAVRERRIKSIINNMQTELQKIMSSCILTDNYPATTIAFNFQVIEMDADIIQSLVNCASLALYKSTLKCRCLPVAITMLIKTADKRTHKSSPGDWIVQDPNLNQLKHQQQYSHRVTMTWSVDTKELISSSLVPLAKQTPLDFQELDTITAMSLSVATGIHGYIVDI